MQILGAFKDKPHQIYLSEQYQKCSPFLCQSAVSILTYWWLTFKLIVKTIELFCVIGFVSCRLFVFRLVYLVAALSLLWAWASWCEFSVLFAPFQDVMAWCRPFYLCVVGVLVWVWRRGERWETPKMNERPKQTTCFQTFFVIKNVLKTLATHYLCVFLMIYSNTETIFTWYKYVMVVFHLLFTEMQHLEVCVLLTHKYKENIIDQPEFTCMH